MRAINVIGHGILVSLLTVISACALEFDDSAPEQQGSEELPTADPDESTVSSDVNILSTPTCDWVASYAGAWVPFFNGSPGTVDCNMVKGCHSAAVQKLQHSMNLCYGEHLSEDSDFGQLTKDALIRTQRKAGTPADGEYGPNTRKAMLHQ